jgi:hypothetical protein
MEGMTAGEDLDNVSVLGLGADGAVVRLCGYRDCATEEEFGLGTEDGGVAGTV